MHMRYDNVGEVGVGYTSRISKFLFEFHFMCREIEANNRWHGEESGTYSLHVHVCMDRYMLHCGL